MATQVSHRRNENKDVRGSGDHSRGSSSSQRTRDTVWRSIPAADRSESNKRDSERLSRAARIEKVEDELIERVFENHPNCQRAMDRLLDDLDGTDASVVDPTTRVTMSQVQRIEMIETLLLAATIDNHPNSRKAMETLLDDVIGDAPTLPPEFFDRDWDGMA